MNLKKIGTVFTSKSVGTGPSSYEKRIYRAAVSQRLRNTVLREQRGAAKCNRLACCYRINPLTPNDYSGRTAPLTSKRCILYIYSTNTGTEYFKHGIYSSFFPLQNAVCFINLTYLVPILFTFYIQRVLKLKK